METMLYNKHCDCGSVLVKEVQLKLLEYTSWKGTGNMMAEVGLITRYTEAKIDYPL